MQAQTPEIIWQHTYGGNSDDRGQDIIATVDGGYLTIGYANSIDGDITFNYGLTDFLVIKTDSVGNIVWSKNYGGSDYDKGYAIGKGLDGGYILAGETGSSDGDVSVNQGLDDLWLIKINETGNIEWEKTYGGSSNEIVLDIELTTDGNYIVTGGTNSSDGDVTENKGLSDFWILKIDPAGAIIWERTYGSSDDEGGYDVLETSEGGFVIAGYTEGDDGDVTFNNGDRDFWIVKLDSLGEMQWQKSYGGSSDDQAYGIVEKPGGGYLCVGVAYSNDGDVIGSHGFGELWVLSLDSSGEVEWQKCYGGTGGEGGNFIILKIATQYIIVGGSGVANGDVTEHNGLNDYWIVSIDSGGVLNWQKSIGGSATETAYAVDRTSDNHLIVSGYTSSSDMDVEETFLPPNFWVVKLGICDIPFYADADSDGYGDILNNTLACVLPVGFVADSTDCNDANNTVFPTAIDICNGIDDNCNGLLDEDAVFTIYYADADGDGFGNQEITTLLCKATEGFVNDSTDCDDTNENVYPGAPEIFNGMDDNCDGLIDEGLNINTIDANTITFYPNPANTEIFIAHDLHILAIITHNSLGEEIPMQFINDVADISTLPPGIYFSEIIAEEGRVIVGWVKN